MTSNGHRRTASPLTTAATVVRLLRSPQIRLLLSLSGKLVTPVYRAAFLTGAASSGVLRRLAEGPADAHALAASLGVQDDTRRLARWLDAGVTLGQLQRRNGTYALRSRLAKQLARIENDAAAGALEEVVRFHQPVLIDAPRMVREGRSFGLGDQDGSVIARSSLVVQPFIEEAVSRVLDRERPVRLLEIGCGSGVYVRHAAALNPRLTAHAIDLQPEVAEEAARNMDRWGLTERVTTRQGDLRTLAFDERYDLVTLHNNIYYFPEADRVEILARAREALAPGGRLLLTTSCQGGGPSLEVLGLWFEFADFGGPLPAEDELVQQLVKAGFTDVEAHRIVPGEQFRAFVGTNA
ncbi:SAM-dependent methyltransferase [Streptomyces alfalfae]